MATLAMELPAFVKGHTPWYPKARVKSGAIQVKCGDAHISAPFVDSGDPKKAAAEAKQNQAATAEAVRVYAKAHGWAEVV